MDMVTKDSSPSSQNGSADWPSVLAEHRRWLRTVVLARLVDRDATEEVLQEVALAATKNAKSIADVSKLPAWLYRVAVRQALLYRRRNGREQRRLFNYAKRVRSEQNNGQSSDPFRWMLADEQASLIRQALMRLREKDRELLLLKYTEDWKCSELAERLGVSVSTVETRLQRARKRLRHELEESNVIEDKR